MFFSSNIFSRYFKQFDWTAIVDDAVSKLISLLFLFILPRSFFMSLLEELSPHP